MKKDFSNKIVKKMKEQFRWVLYSPKLQKIIITIPIQYILVREGGPDFNYFEYADSELFGKYIFNSKLEKDAYDFIGEL